MTEKIALIIPCFDVEKTIEKVLVGISNETLKQISEIICIDNDSNDNTRNILKRIASGKSELSRKITLIFNLKNYGYGGSQKNGIEYCLKKGIHYFIIIHSDNQCNTDETVRNFLICHKKKPHLDIILTDRFSKNSDISHYSTLRIFGNRLFNLVTRILTGFHIPDAGAAIIFGRTEIFKKIPFTLCTSGFQFHPELNIFLYRDKTIKKEEIPMSWKDSEVTKHFNLIKYGLELASILLRYAIMGGICRLDDNLIFSHKDNRIKRKYNIQKSGGK